MGNKKDFKFPNPLQSTKPPHVSRQERKRLAKEKGKKFVPLASPPQDMVAQQIVGCRQRITTAELDAMKEADSGK